MYMQIGYNIRILTHNAWNIFSKNLFMLYKKETVFGDYINTSFININEAETSFYLKKC